MPSEDPNIWTQTIELVVPLHVAMAMHGAMCLALRHPDMTDDEHAAARDWIQRVVRRLGVLLVVRGGLTPDELALAERDEGLEPTDIAAELDRQAAMRAAQERR